MKMFDVRAVTLDYYVSKPIGELKRDNHSKEWQEPVIRIFGSTSDGLRCCVHVHGAYPYIYVPYKGGEKPDRDALLFGAALDEALKISLSSKVNRFVHKVTPTLGIPLYGYHLKQEWFLKIYLCNPYHVRKASELLLSGAILGQKFQPHEAHIPYALQFMMDYNVYGMSFVTFSKVKYRRNPEHADSLSGIKREDILSEKVQKMTSCYLEVDALANDILNKMGENTGGVNPGLRAIWEDEKKRRREQDRNSDITIIQSQSRPEIGVCPTESMYKARLAQKLEQVSLGERVVASDDHPLSYPAEVLENRDFLEASVVEENMDVPLERENVGDVSYLIDSKILTQISGEQEKVESESEDDDTEPDSVLCKEQKKEEAELEEEEEGVDMTQPLESYESFICGPEGNRDEPGYSYEDKEDSFWRNMADKIFQLDGAQESSSESELETPPGTAPGGPAESLSNNIMSILSEDGGCPTPSTVCQTPRTFWSNYSSNWLPQNQDAWNWNKNQNDIFDFSVGTEPYAELFTSNESDFSSAGMTPVCTESVPSAAPTPPDDINLNSICGSFLSPLGDKLDSKFSERKITINRKPDSDQGNFLQVLKSFAGRSQLPPLNNNQMTLKQYIKDCEEIVSVDFKTLCNREMIIIEYKSMNKKSVRNKYLIKPLDKFLESWNSAERKAISLEEKQNLRSVINVLENSVQSVSNKVTVKSMEILPESGSGSGGGDRCYNINQNVISQGKIRMKLIKSQRDEERLKRQRLDLNRAKGSKREECRSQRKKGGGTCNKKHFSEPDSKLINEINSSFEEYFKSIIERKNFHRKSKRSCGETRKEESEEEDKTETSDDEKPKEKRSNDAVKLVTRFLSSFSRMSDIPPLSITISLGNPVQPMVTSGNKQYNGKERRKVENVDGPADGSSSSSDEDGLKRRIRNPKKIKREGYYKPLNVVVYGSSEKKRDGARKRKMCEEMRDKEEEVLEVERRGRKRVFTDSSQDPVDVCREKPKSWPPKGRESKETSHQSLVRDKQIQPNLNKSSPNVRSSSDLSQELDFIDDSDEERKWKLRRKTTKCPKMNAKVLLKRIPQADTDAFTSSDDDEWKRFRDKIIEKKVTQVVEKIQESEEPAEKQNLRSETISKEDAELAEAKLPHSPLACSQVFESAPQPEPSIALKPADNPDVQPTCSPFTLSGSPLFLSKRDVAGTESPASSFIPLEPTSPPSSGVCQSSDSSKTFLQETLKWEDGVAGRSSSMDLELTFLDYVIGCKTIKPKQNPLTHKEVIKSLQVYDVVENEENAPFFSDPRDMSKAVETGPRVLKIENRSMAGLKPFKSSLNILGTEERRMLLSKGEKAERCLLVGTGDLRITPLIKPPSLNSVTRWLASKRQSGSGKSGRKPEKTKIKILKPLSPGQEEESEEEMELSVTMSFSGEEKMRESPKNPSQVMETNLGLRKGPLSKIKGIKRLLLLKELTTVAEEESPEMDDHPVVVSKEIRNSDNSFQIRGVTLSNSFGFSRSVHNLQNVNQTNTYQYMSMLVMELHIQTRKDFRPDPDHDPIRALFYAITFDSPTKSQESGILVVGEGFLSGSAVSGHSIQYLPTERALVEKWLELVRVWDPEILAGYEIEMHSWGYLVQRGFVLEMNLLLLLGRVCSEYVARKDYSESSDDGVDIPRSVKHMRISGRIVLDVWRVLRHEIALTSYTFENVMYHLSHQRHPVLSYENLSHYWEHPGSRLRYIVVDHYSTRVHGLIKILDQLDFVNRTSELSRLFGIQFYEVLSRGSQFRVESMMLRLAKPLNYVAASPSVAQRAAMRAPASLPLILEPESLFYSDPVIVLDFQSLYPSIIIAYNYCFSTCLGRVDKLGGREPFEFGCTQLQISPEYLKRLENDISISPAGVAFVRSNIRKGVLPTMLEEILETRLMVKKSMKENKENKTLLKVLYARQLGLKLIANVTYGYTAANFSGRMPCIEVGDSVVSKGRETLHRAIQMVKSTRKWGARVVYGDTDSIFVLTPGRTREEAFKIGEEIADAVTRDNPKPVKLKMEKVYQPSILQTKKRYVGYMFESPDQEKPVFEAKGIETVRRDGCPATKKILEKALRILFDTRDVSLVKKYTVRQFAKLFLGRVNMQDLIFAKEYRGRKGYRPGACVPALQLARQWTQYDRRAEPRTKERVPYVIVNGPPGVPLIRLVRSPRDFISDPCLRINAVYYITKAIIPPMQRCFSLLGADVSSWFAEMPRKFHKTIKPTHLEGLRKSTISQYFAAVECVVCSQITNSILCQKCENRAQVSCVCLSEKIRRWERSHEGLLEICRSCCGRNTEVECVSLDCPVLFRRKQAERDAKQCVALREVLVRFL